MNDPSTGHRKNNWSLFHALAAVTREQLGGPIDHENLKRNLMICMEWYQGDGMFSDGRTQRFDDYNFWVFATHYGLWWEMDRERFPELARKIPDILRQSVRHQPYTFGSDGSHPEYGRSITYKFTRLASLIQAHRLGFCDVPPGQIRRIIRLHVLHYMQNGALDLENQRLLQGLSRSGSLDIRDYYNFPGSTYWAMQTFSELWRLADDDPMWTDDEERLPVEKSDFVHKMAAPGWKLVGTKNSGSIIQFNLGTDGPPEYIPKYHKQAYHSQLGYLAGNSKYVPCDHMAVVRIDKINYFPTLEDWDKSLGPICRKEEIYPTPVPGLKVTHLLLPLGETLLRFTRIEVPDKLPPHSQLHLGGYALGFSSLERPDMRRHANLLEARTTRFQTLLCHLGGDSHRQQMDPRGYLGRTDFHTREQSFVLPYHALELTGDSTLLLAQACYGSTHRIDPTRWLARFKVIELTKHVVQFSVDGERHSAAF